MRLIWRQITCLITSAERLYVHRLLHLARVRVGSVRGTGGNSSYLGEVTVPRGPALAVTLWAGPAQGIASTLVTVERGLLIPPAYSAPEETVRSQVRSRNRSQFRSQNKSQFRSQNRSQANREHRFMAEGKETWTEKNAKNNCLAGRNRLSG